MIALLTWPIFGTWLAIDANGRFEDCAGGELALPEPDGLISLRRRRGLKWPVIDLDARQRQMVIDDIHRMAGFRRFAPLKIVAARDHVHLLMETALSGDDQLHQLVQLIKGATARALTVAGGDVPARDPADEVLPHHKWWSRQYVLQRLVDRLAVQRAQSLIDQHN
jgi:REP element-mobilizing transposase RayT